MKILVLNYEFPPVGGGGSYVSYDISKGLAQLGHEVDVVTMKYKDTPSFETVDGMNVYRVPCLRTKKEICHPWEQLTYLISAKFFLKKLMRQKKYDFCHAHFIIPTASLALWLRKKYGLKYYITSHGSDVLGYNRRFDKLYPLLKGMWKKIANGAEFITAPSDFLRDKIKAVDPLLYVKVIPNGIDEKKFSVKKKKKVILVVARLFENKGVGDIIEAISSIDLGAWRLEIVGDGPEMETLKKRCEDAGLIKKKKAVFHGWIDNKDQRLKKIYEESAIFVSASRFESFGMTVLESVKAGCYPLLSDIPGHRYVVAEDKYYYKTGDVPALAKRLEKLISSKSLSQNINVSRFHWKNVVSIFEKAFSAPV